jgi:predicted enzyme related to lactoylglutathione lyase
MSSIGSLIMVNLDSPDPPALAAFYRDVLGWEVTHSEGAYAMISDGTGSIGFGLVEGYQPPPWPDTAAQKRFHLDFSVDDLDDAEKRCVALGATKPEFQPGGERWRVLTDPAGHPFCICPRP